MNDERHQIQFKRALGGAQEAVGRVLRVTGGFESFNGPALSRAHSGEKPNGPLCPRLPRLHGHPLFSMSPHQSIQFLMNSTIQTNLHNGIG